MMKKILITGGAGFIGSNFIRYLLNKEENIFIINLDKLTYAGNLENLYDIEKNYKDKYTFIQNDICNKQVVKFIFKEYMPEYVINFAAESHVDRSILDPNTFMQTNIFGTAVLLNAARKSWSKNDWGKNRFIQISTDEVYGSLQDNQKELLFTEETTLNPHSPYSASKAAADCIVKSYYYTYGFPALISRCSNNYGPYQNYEKLIPLIIKNALNNKSLPVYGDGKNVRDWIYVEDHCDAVWSILSRGKIGEVYNIGGNNEMQNIEIIKIILDYLKKPYSLIKYVEDRPGHDRRYAMNSSKIQNELGWKPEYKFDKKIIDTIEWYVNNSKFTKNILNN